MLYKVFLVEDEIVAREGIRDNVDWGAAGFEFCGEAPDGEMALPLLETTQPDVLITDIKMPFMDGLQLCKIVRARLPWVKIIILSGHDEFNYAQESVKLGVTEYLLKPIGVQDLHNVLQKVASQLDQEREEKENLHRLKDQVEGSLVHRREQFLLKLVMGGASPLEAVEQSQRLEMDIIAKCYQVLIIKIELGHSPDKFDYIAYQQAERIASGLLENNPDVFLLKKDMEELVLILKGDSFEHLEQEGYFFTELIKNEVESKTNCLLTVATGSPQERLGDIHHSFAEALAKIKTQIRQNRQVEADDESDKTELLKLDKAALEEFLKFGVKEDFDDFFAAYIGPLSQTALKSYFIKNYIFIDIVLTTAKFVNGLGGVVDQIIPEIHHVETLLMNIRTVEQVREESQKIFASALAFRDSQTPNQYTTMLHQAKGYIDAHYTNPELALNEVAEHVSLSSSHFSMVFGRETGETFKEYLTRVRIEEAKELLQTTTLKSFQISYQIGYNDPHYFSYVFKKQTGFSPKKFRLRTRAG